MEVSSFSFYHFKIFSISIYFYLIFSDIIHTKVFKREISHHDPTIYFVNKYGTLERRRLDSIGTSTNTAGALDIRADESLVGGAVGSSTGGLKQRPSGVKRYKFLQFFDSLKESERLIRLSNVLLNQDGTTWDWDVIIAILKVR